MEPSYLEDFLHLVQVDKHDGEITSVLKVVADLRSSNINYLGVEVFRNKLLLLLVAKYSGLSRDIVKYLDLNGDRIIEDNIS